ncbi:hypothetical protein ACFFWD_36740 [Bradyrhizobium erythrophlei]|uniref:hypothetical protein n=1 Tax=Bradyrhizobium erythrophlei TaxID=1437360 RepID=UPI0035EDAE28
MLGLLIILVALGIGFGSGYGIREMISRRRRRAARGDVPKAQPLADTGRDDAINLERLLVAANDDLSGRRRQQPSGRGQPAQAFQSEQFDGAVRDLLGELNRRPSEQSSSPRRTHQ